MADHDASEIALRVGFMMKVLSEERNGARVIKSQGELSARLMRMATHPGNEYKQKVAIVYELYTARRMLAGPVDVYVEALTSICESVDGQDGQEKEQQEQQEQEVFNNKQDGQKEEREEQEVLGCGRDGQKAEREVRVDEEDEKQEVRIDEEDEEEEEDGDKEILGDGQDEQQEEEEEVDDDDMLGDEEEEEEIDDDDTDMEVVDAGIHETYESITKHPTGPLRLNAMPRVPVDVTDEAYGVASIQPWTSAIFASESIVLLPLPRKLPGVIKRRRSTIMRFYRSGRMYAKLRDGRIARCSDKQIQRHIDVLNEQRGGDLTVKTWMDFVGKVVSDKESREVLKKTTLKRNRSGSAEQSKKQARTSWTDKEETEDMFKEFFKSETHP